MNDNMSAPLTTKFKWFWHDQDAEQEEWLRQMAAQGLHLHWASNFIWHFSSGAPADVVYRVDYLRKLDPDYACLLEDAGWEHVTETGGWHYWRTAAVPGQVQELFTDLPSRRAKFSRLLLTMTAATASILMMTTNAGFRQRLMHELSWPFQLLWLSMVLIVVVGVARILLRMWRLRQPS